MNGFDGNEWLGCEDSNLVVGLLHSGVLGKDGAIAADMTVQATRGLRDHADEAPFTLPG